MGSAHCARIVAANCADPRNRCRARPAVQGRTPHERGGRHKHEPVRRKIMYDPAVGRFLEEDPIGFSGRDANLSRYVHNAPTMATDPYGLKVLKLAFSPASRWRVDYAARERIRYVHVPDNVDVATLLKRAQASCCTITELRLTDDQQKLVGMARGNASVEKRIAAIFNALERAPRDYGFTASLEGFYDFGQYADLEGKGWCEAWVDAMLPRVSARA